MVEHKHRETRVDFIGKRLAVSMEKPRKKSGMVIKTFEITKVKTANAKGAHSSFESTRITLENGRSESTQDIVLTSLGPEKPSVTPVLQRKFGSIIISLENCLLPPERLHPTPSILEGMEARTEWYLRRLGCDIIQHAGILLKLPQTAMATGQVLYQRFYYARSFVRNDYLTVGMACVYLSSKVEEAPRRLRDIINVFTHIRQTLCSEPLDPILLDYGYVNLKNQVIKCERRLLKELGFCVHVKHPHKLIVMYLQLLEMDRNRAFVQQAWNYMNDSLRTDLFVRYPPETIACGCIFLAARELQIPLPRKPSWYQLLNVTAENMSDIATNILLLYSIKLIPIPDIERKVNILRAAADSARTKGMPGHVREVEEDKTPDSIQTTPEPRKDGGRAYLDDPEDRKLSREKRSREDRSPDRRDTKRYRSRSRSLARDVRQYRVSRSRSPFSKSAKSRKSLHRRDSLKSEKTSITKSRKGDYDRRRSRSRSASREPRRRSRSRSFEFRPTYRDRDNRH